MTRGTPAPDSWQAGREWRIERYGLHITHGRSLEVGSDPRHEITHMLYRPVAETAPGEAVARACGGISSSAGVWTGAEALPAVAMRRRWGAASRLVQWRCRCSRADAFRGLGFSPIVWSFFRRAYLVCIFAASVLEAPEIVMQPFDPHDVFLKHHSQCLRREMRARPGRALDPCHRRFLCCRSVHAAAGGAGGGPREPKEGKE